MPTIHSGLAQRWNRFERWKQILNTVSELSRSRSWLSSDPTNVQLSIERSFELIDFCVADSVQWNGNRRRELLRLRETLAAFYLNENKSALELDAIISALVHLDAQSAAFMPTV